MAYAHALIEAPDGTRYDRGDEVDLSKFDDAEVEELYDGGALSDEDYDPEVDRVGPPAVIEIEGVRYVQTTDGAEGGVDAEVW